MRQSRRLTALCFASLVAYSMSAGASPEDVFGLGPRSPAMGGTGAAHSFGWEATYTNPALLSRVHHNAVALGLAGAAFDLHASGANLPGRVSALPAKGFVVGAEVPVPFGGVLRDRIAAGFAFYTPSGALVRGRILYPEAPDYPLLADRTQSLTVRLGAGADIGCGLRAGASFAALANLSGNVAVANTAGAVSSRVDDQLVATYAPSFGVAWDLPFGEAPDGSASWRIGATWRGSIAARFGVNVDASKLSTLRIPVFNIAGIAQYDPAQIALEVAHERAGWTFAAGVTWKHWGAYPGVFEPTVLCPPGQDCSALTPPAIGFSDTLVPRAGAERVIVLPRGAVVRLRAGFFYEPTPVPSSLAASAAYDLAAQGLVGVPTRFFDASRYVATLGGGVDMGELAPFTVDLWAQLHLLSAATVQTCTGDSAPCTPDIGSGPAQLSGAVVAFGALLGVRF
jgi:long-chain fatty acid transport protein